MNTKSLRFTQIPVSLNNDNGHAYRINTLANSSIGTQQNIKNTTPWCHLWCFLFFTMLTTTVVFSTLFTWSYIGWRNEIDSSDKDKNLAQDCSSFTQTNMCEHADMIYVNNDQYMNCNTPNKCAKFWGECGIQCYEKNRRGLSNVLSEACFNSNYKGSNTPSPSPRAPPLPPLGSNNLKNLLKRASVSEIQYYE